MVYLVLLGLVCLAVLGVLCHQLITNWHTGGVGGNVSRVALILVWVWASVSFILRLNNRRKAQ